MNTSWLMGTCESGGGNNQGMSSPAKRAGGAHGAGAGSKQAHAAGRRRQQAGGAGTAPHLLRAPGLVCGAVHDGLVHALEHKLARAVPVHRQHALAAVYLLGLLGQQVAHEHVEAVLVQRAPRNDAHLGERGPVGGGG
jgi:hypothetical protein